MSDPQSALGQALAQRGHEIQANVRAEARPVINFTDPDTGEAIGALVIRGGVLAFEGRAEESARLLFENVTVKHDAALRALADAIRGTHEGARDGMKLVGTTALTRDALRRGAVMLRLERPYFDGQQ